jgi:hypothetical protein
VKQDIIVPELPSARHVLLEGSVTNPIDQKLAIATFARLVTTALDITIKQGAKPACMEIK